MLPASGYSHLFICRSSLDVVNVRYLVDFCENYRLYFHIFVSLLTDRSIKSSALWMLKFPDRFVKSKCRKPFIVFSNHVASGQLHLQVIS